ncbi:fatty acid elongase [Capsaspora owczarzaki ATCC 30864]|uniref:Elongation of fatty acids protein n=1 Tax=Capsaspora owczarzaki (strain ATCC 30864) TaxID=595528 RepID=A0A0D2WQH3_CAPO3|nr:fatty acid elongase [Capsaspora owczarzaki ATCC 30864]KJE93158.1 fatty acid elongase [Capsaspora owczarzaki ATCC 30864]|eukprot:XP_004347812.1 fatty acid elongase [Capsaspora owczarzaki ATCC 30864]
MGPSHITEAAYVAQAPSSKAAGKRDPVPTLVSQATPTATARTRAASAASADETPAAPATAAAAPRTRRPDVYAKGLTAWAMPAFVGLLVAAGYALADMYQETISTFQYQQRITPLHAMWVPVTAVTCYAIGIFTLKRFVMDKRDKPVDGKFIQVLMFLHNGFLSAWSLVMLLKISTQIATTGYNAFVSETDTVNECLWCDSNKAQVQNNELYFWYHVFYISKFYEFIDTVFIVIRKKPLIFLHYYHHIITLLLCWVTMDDQLAPQWICIATNTLVHVFMYYFYMVQSAGFSVWWKRHLTKLQIIQFVADQIGNHMWVYYAWIVKLACPGSVVGYAWGTGVIGSFLVLFLQFYARTYKRPAAGDKRGTPVKAE